ncbi:MAG: ABC transporter ATP-binding protein, partial [Planctomycetes bacterium]|nr:ABC transporter ATP-binding protein [Planctomycetota bacterium]
MRIRPRHAAWLLVPAGAAAALLAAVRAPDPAPVRAKRELAQRMLARLDRQSSELAEEDAKFEAEIVRVEGRHREKAVEREALVKE